MKFSTIGIAAMTGDAVWSPESLSLGSFNLGPGSAVYLAGQQTRLEPNGTTSVVGESALRVLARLRRGVLQHWPNEATLARIKEWSPRGTQVGLWVNYINVNQRPPWDQRSRPLWDLARAHLVVGTDGKPVDVYEGQVTPYHAWAVDIGREDYALRFVEAIEMVVRVNYRVVRPDFWFVDEILKRRYWGTATNAPEAPLESDWQLDYTEFLERLQGTVGPVWGHDAGHDGYLGTLFGNLHEHPLRGKTTQEELLGKVQTMRQEGRNVGLGLSRDEIARPWDWQALLTGYQDERIHLQTLRTGSEFGLWHPGKEIAW